MEVCGVHLQTDCAVLMVINKIICVASLCLRLPVIPNMSIILRCRIWCGSPEDNDQTTRVGHWDWILVLAILLFLGFAGVGWGGVGWGGGGEMVMLAGLQLFGRVCGAGVGWGDSYRFCLMHRDKATHTHHDTNCNPQACRLVAPVRASHK